jgi:hypothetical protein
VRNYGPVSRRGLESQVEKQHGYMLEVNYHQVVPGWRVLVLRQRFGEELRARQAGVRKGQRARRAEKRVSQLLKALRVGATMSSLLLVLRGGPPVKPVHPVVSAARLTLRPLFITCLPKKNR